MRALQYAFDEAIASLWRGRTSGLLSTATIAVALFVLGAFLVVTTNLQRLGEEWSRSAEMSVYLADDATDENRAEVEKILAPGPLVEGSTFVSKEEALERFKQTFADLAAAADTVGGNRPSFSGAAPPAHGRALYDAVLLVARERHAPVASGEFGADMQVELVNDGPVTIPLRVA